LPRPISGTVASSRTPAEDFRWLNPPFRRLDGPLSGRPCHMPPAVRWPIARPARSSAQSPLWLPPIMTLGTKMWTSVATTRRSPPRKPFHSSKLLSLVLSGGLMTYLAPFHLGSLYRDSDDKNLLWDGLNIYNKGIVCQEKKLTRYEVLSQAILGSPGQRAFGVG